MPSPFHDHLACANKYVQWADAETERLHAERMPSGPTPADLGLPTLLYRAAELHLKMAELTKGQQQ